MPVKRLPFLALLLVLPAPFLPAATGVGTTYYFPHMADGQIGSNGFAQEFAFCNASPTTAASVTLSFFQEDGSPWTVNVDSWDRPGLAGAWSSRTFTLQSWETVHVVTLSIPMEALEVGWTTVVSDQPLILSSDFQYLDLSVFPPRVEWAVGVLPAPSSTLSVFNANVSSADYGFASPAVDMGFAIANPSTWDATVTVDLFARNGDHTPLASAEVTVPHDGHVSRYLSQLFSGVSFGNRFHGYVRFSSTVNVAVMALKSTQAGGRTVYSAIPAIPLSETWRHVAYDREPNNAAAGAQPITAPVEVIGTNYRPLGVVDKDYYAIDLTAGQTITASLIANWVGSELEGMVDIRDPTDSFTHQFAIAGSSPSAVYGGEAMAYATVPDTGTYYVVVTTPFWTTASWVAWSYRLFVHVAN